MESFRAVFTLYRPWAGQMPSDAESALRLELTNGSRVVSLPGNEQNVRGFSKVALLVVDEASRVLDSLYLAIVPMTAISQGRVIALSTPAGRRGWWWQEWTAGDDWQRVEVPASACPRIPASWLAQQRRSLPTAWYQSEYCCQFVDAVDAVFATEDIMFAVADGVPLLFGGTL